MARASSVKAPPGTRGRISFGSGSVPRQRGEAVVDHRRGPGGGSATPFDGRAPAGPWPSVPRRASSGAVGRGPARGRGRTSPRASRATSTTRTVSHSPSPRRAKTRSWALAPVQPLEARVAGRAPMVPVDEERARDRAAGRPAGRRRRSRAARPSPSSSAGAGTRRGSAAPRVLPRLPSSHGWGASRTASSPRTRATKNPPDPGRRGARRAPGAARPSRRRARGGAFRRGAFAAGAFVRAASRPAFAGRLLRGGAFFAAGLGFAAGVFFAAGFFTAGAFAARLRRGLRRRPSAAGFAARLLGGLLHRAGMVAGAYGGTKLHVDVAPPDPAAGRLLC